MDQAWVDQKLLEIGPALLSYKWKNRWSASSPTTGYCYLLSEVLYHFVYTDSKSYVVRPDNLGTHWYLIDQDGGIIDYTQNQYALKVDHRDGRRCAFLRGSVKTHRGTISKKGFLLAVKLGFTK